MDIVYWWDKRFILIIIYLNKNPLNKTQWKFFLNSLAHRRIEWNFAKVISKTILVIGALKLLPNWPQVNSLDLTDDKPTLVQCQPNSVSWYSITSPQWVKNSEDFIHLSWICTNFSSNICTFIFQHLNHTLQLSDAMTSEYEWVWWEALLINEWWLSKSSICISPPEGQ